MSAVRGPHLNPVLEQTWRDRIARWTTDGLSIRAFCAREGLSEPSFYAWRRTLRERDAGTLPPTAPAPDAPAFVPVHVLPAAPPVALDLVLRSGLTVRVPPGFDPGHLRAVVAALEGRPC
jgi:hypothetical protein